MRCEIFRIKYRGLSDLNYLLNRNDYEAEMWNEMKYFDENLIFQSILCIAVSVTANITSTDQVRSLDGCGSLSISQ
ncbi:hypothetical protein T01_15285, partial [Trichinella spiralis]